MRTFCNSRNPILPPDIHIPDSEAHVMPDGRLCLYGSFDSRDDVFCSTEYHVVTTPDLENWTVHDAALLGGDVPWFNNPRAPHYPGIDWRHPTPFIRRMMAEDEKNGVDLKAKFSKPNGPEPPLLFAPDCLYRQGRYYLYFCMKDNSEGVAVADRPEGPFRNPVQLPCGGIDPAVFADDDGQVYFYWGQLHSHGVRLAKDLVSFDPAEIVDDLVTEEEHYFHEGSSLRKINGRYYYLYADIQRGKPTALGYAIGESPLGPFRYQGILIDNAACDPQSWNNHGSIECVNGQWYVFYHRSSGNSQLHRRLCMEPITIAADGTIAEVRMTSQGAGQPYAPGEKIPAYQACEVGSGAYIDGGTTESQPPFVQLCAGGSAVFRYFRCESPCSKARLRCSGKGKAALLAGEKTVCLFDVQSAGSTEAAAELPAGQWELTLHALDGGFLQVSDLVLE